MIKHTLIAALMACLTAPVFAGEDPAKRSERFKSLDSNNNGHVSQFEAKGKHRIFYYYQKADRNDDGHIDMSEFSAFEIETPYYEIK